MTKYSVRNISYDDIFKIKLMRNSQMDVLHLFTFQNVIR